MFENFVLKRSGSSKNIFILVSLLFFTVSIFGFFILALYVASHPTLSFDNQVLKNIQSLDSPLVATLLKFVSLFGEVYFAPVTLAVVMVVLFFKGLRKEAILAPVVLVGSFFTYVSKDLIGRPRPDQFSLNLGYSTPSDYSFPSGHVVYYTLLFGMIAFLALASPKLGRKSRILFLSVSALLIVLVGISRVYLGVHWPSDVVGGYLLGFALLEIVVLAYLKFVYLPQVWDKQNQPDNNREF